jgi:hypothetical protein
MEHVPVAQVKLSSSSTAAAAADTGTSIFVAAVAACADGIFSVVAAGWTGAIAFALGLLCTATIGAASPAIGSAAPRVIYRGGGCSSPVCTRNFWSRLTAKADTLTGMEAAAASA